MMAKGVLPVVVGISAVVLLSLSAAPVNAGRVGEPSTWNERVQESDALLRRGEYREARNLTRRLAEEMGALLLGGEASERALGSVLGLHALALAGTGNLEDAEWYWFLGQSLKPDLGQVDLRAYGDAGRSMEAIRDAADERLKERPDRTEIADGEGSPAQGDGACSGKLTPPAKVEAPNPKYPPEVREVGLAGKVVLSLVVSKKGRLQRPVALASPAPSLTWAVAEELRRWRFVPARCDGRPVEAYYNLTVNMSAGR